MADVLLSLKRAVVHPSTGVGVVIPSLGASSSSTYFHPNSSQLPSLSPMSQSCYNPIGINFGERPSSQSVSSPGNCVSYSLYPQLQMSSNSSLDSQRILRYKTDIPPPTPLDIGDCNGASQPIQPQGGTIFPTSMSVNLSMNMTMAVSGFGEHKLYTGLEEAKPKVQWSASIGAPGECRYTQMQADCGQVQAAHSSLPSPHHSSSTSGICSFTAELQPGETVTLQPLDKEFPPNISPLKYWNTCVPGTKHPDNNYHHLVATGKPQPRFVPVAPYTGHFFSQMGGMGDILSSCTKPNLCRVCGKTYARSSTLKIHLRTHSGERPYWCNMCNKSFSQAANLTAHIRTHSGEKPFGCPLCERRFSQSSSVTTHMRTHSGERPYLCNICKKTFSDSSTLTKHLRIHSGEKPYECKLCLLRFSQSGNLNRHMRVHTSTG
ncbi:protein glass-like [Limulus polyphemus]|uniref:Protein glass-like n=1 Tax=Limulus polyphemus TaxID=6850 RepID=A0ABM1B0X3_LIMPO|nr:protein glass-like [Limulus polyphemus]